MGIKDVFKSINPFSTITDLKKQVNTLMTGVLRPYNAKTRQLGLYPEYRYGSALLKNLSYNSDVLSTIHNTLRREMFRNGYDLIPAKNTDSETTISDEESQETGNRKAILENLECVNENEQTIIDIYMEFEDNLSIYDDAYLLFIKNYQFNTSGEIVDYEPGEILTVDPLSISKIMNSQNRLGYDDQNRKVMVCPEHRDRIQYDQDYCNCGKKLYKACYEAQSGDNNVYYFKDEVLHVSKYRPSIRYGFSPVITVWQKVRTLLYMDKYIMEMYTRQRPPKAGLFFKTSNQDGLQKMWANATQKAQEKPHMPLVMGIENSTNGDSFVQFIDFMKSLNEMQYTEQIKNMVRMIGAVYGVEPIFNADMSQSGGLNNEGLQITVTNRAIEYGQNIYNTKVNPKILQFYKAKGWSFELQPNEEQDEMAKLQRQNQSLMNGEIALRLGLEAKYDSDIGEVVIKGGDLEKQETPEFDNDDGFNPFGSNEPDQEVSGMPDKMFELEKSDSSKISQAIKNEIDKFFKIFKRKPTEAELQKALNKINLNLENELKEEVRKKCKLIYDSEVQKVEKELGKNILMSHVDKEALAVLGSQDVLSKAYSNLSSTATDKIKEIIDKAFRNPEGLSSQKIQKEIQNLIKITDFRAETIARTESSKISAAARKNSYKKEGDFENMLFEWIGPNDNRTTEVSRNIKARTKGGVTWEELIKIVREESSRKYPKWTVDKNYPVSHYNSRHTFVKLNKTLDQRKSEVALKEKAMQDKIEKEIEEKEYEARKKLAQDELDTKIKNTEVKLLKKKAKILEELERDMNND